jgi:hypothetical protein
MNLDEYRIIIAQGPQYAAIATSTNWDLIRSEYDRLHKEGEAFRRSFGSRRQAAEEFIAWIIRKKFESGLDSDLFTDEDRQTFTFELHQLQTLPPVQLANLERGYYETWKLSESAAESEKAPMMTWACACAWEIEEIVRKFKNRRQGDQWGMKEFADLQQKQPASSAPVKAAPNIPKIDDANISSQAEQHPVYGIFFRMLRNGIPRAAVEQKMKLQNCDISVLDNPISLQDLKYGVESSSGNGLADALQGVARQKVQTSSKPALSSGPFKSVFQSLMGHPKFTTLRRLNKENDDDEFD